MNKFDEFKIVERLSIIKDLIVEYVEGDDADYSLKDLLLFKDVVSKLNKINDWLYKDLFGDAIENIDRYQDVIKWED